MSVTDTSPQGGTDSAQPSTNFDNPANWDYYDPDDEKPDTVKPPTTKGTEGETDEDAEGIQEADQTEPAEEDDTEAKAEGEEGDDKEKAKDILVPMPNGESLPLEEVRKGYLRQSDYTRGKQDLANRVRWVDERAHYIASQAQAVEQFIAEQMPQRPDPMLAHQNPSQYLAMERYYEEWQNRLAYAQQASQQALGIGGEVNETMNAEETREALKSEFQALSQVMPNIKAPKDLQKFYEGCYDVAADCGFSPDDVHAIDNHKFVKVLDWARKGFAAEKAKQTARQKVAGVPPVAPQKRSAGQATPGVKNREAMQRLSKSGSIHDAVNVDFD